VHAKAHVARARFAEGRCLRAGRLSEPRADRELFEQLIASILVKHRIEVLDEPVLNLRVPALMASTEVFLEAPLRVRDAFFFRGV
jgi:hypothetical protein